MIGATVVSTTANMNVKNVLFDVKNGAVSVAISIGGYDIKKIEYGDEIFIEDFGRLLIPGKPSLPSKIFSIAIPPGAKVADIIFSTKDEVLSGSYKIPPSSLPRVIGEEIPLIYEQQFKNYNENYESVYNSDNPYPTSIAELVGTGGYRKYNLVDVRVNPFTYHPVSGKLIYHSTISVSVRYTISKDFSSKDIMIDNLPQTEKIAQGIILNYDQAKNWYPGGPSGRELYDYVIITTDSLTSSVTPLVDWEEAKNRDVNVVTTSWISNNYQGYDLAAKIRAFLLEKYPSSKWGIQDVCLVGNYIDVPMRKMAVDIGLGLAETDYYYAELSLPDNESWDADGDHQYGEYTDDPIDFETEVSVGRIPWSEPAIVQSICEKSVAFEQNTNNSFKKNILLLGAFFTDDPDSRTDNAVLMEYKINSSNNPWMANWTKTRMYEQGYSTYPMDYDLTYDNVKNIWSNGSYAFVDWAGHGSPFECVRFHPSMTSFVNTGTCQYLNDNYPAIIFACACSNSDTNYSNLGQAMLNQGAVGFVGSNKIALGRKNWSNPMDGSSQSLDYYFTSCCTSGNYTQGQALQWSLHEMYVNHLWAIVRFETFEWGSLFGNPDLTMGTITIYDPPETPQTPDGPNKWILNVECNFTASTTDPNGSQVYYMFDWGDGNCSAWFGPYPSGQKIEGSHSWAQLGNYQIKVRAKNVNGAKSNWSEPLLLTIVEDQPPDKPIINGKILIIGGLKYNYIFVSRDPENHDIYYKIDWGDGYVTDWLGTYSSGESMTLGNTWHEKGIYTIKVWAKDILGKISDQGNFMVKVLFVINSYQSSNQMLNNLLQNLQHKSANSQSLNT